MKRLTSLLEEQFAESARLEKKIRKNMKELGLKKDSLVPVRSLAPVERIKSRILFIRGEKVMLDADLAGLYGVETRAIVQAVKRNIERFPADFMFQLTRGELDVLRSQSVISKPLGVDAHNLEAAIAANLKELGFGKG